MSAFWFFARKLLRERVALVFGIFFAVWWTAAAYVLTYDKGYLSLGNGYIGIWLATVCSYLILLDVWLRDGDGTDVEKTEEVKAVEGAVPTTTENEPAQD